MKIPIIDDFLNKITMYRLTLYYLLVLVGIAIVLSFFSVLSYSPLDIAIEAGVAIVCCYMSNKILAFVFHAVTNNESMLITALILTLIMPVKFPDNLLFFICVSVFAMAAKYLPTIEKRHIFNPAAAGVAAVALLFPEHVATWWVGTTAMMPFVLMGGLLLVRKIRREEMVTIFLAVFFLLVGIFSFVHNGSIAAVLNTWKQSIISSSLLFFAFVMFTEPLTSPSTEKMQNYYAVIVACLYATPQTRLFGIILTPEIALLYGNIFSYIVNPKYRFVLHLKEKILASKDTYIFSFGKMKNFQFFPGQYMEWTLPHTSVDSRGNRRYFSIASSPEEDLQIMVRFYDSPSSYKKKLLSISEKDCIVVSSLEGSFVLPKDTTKPLVFVAGGVGIAPFRSMIQSLLDKKEKRDIVVLYANRLYQEIAFADTLEKAKDMGVKTIYTLTDTKNIPDNWQGETGYFSTDMIQKYIPDFEKRIFYLSGPQPMVQTTEQVLMQLGIHRKNIKMDYFPGYES